MTTLNIEISRKEGIGEMIPHIVQTACAFKSSVAFEVGDKKINAKSIMGVMALAGQAADSIRISADGADEAEAVRAISELLQ